VPMKRWRVEFVRVESYEVEIDAKNMCEAEEIATKLIQKDSDEYLVNDEGLECNLVTEIEDDPYEGN
jgi:hypothetical protein